MQKTVGKHHPLLGLPTFMTVTVVCSRAIDWYIPNVWFQRDRLKGPDFTMRIAVVVSSKRPYFVR